MWAQSTKLVGNISQRGSPTAADVGPAGGVLLSYQYSQAQGFVTGGHEAGHFLASVELYIHLIWPGGVASLSMTR